MFNDDKKRLYIVGGVVGGVILIVLLIFIFIKMDKDGDVFLNGVDINNGSGSVGNSQLGSGYDGSIGSIGSTNEVDKKVDVIMPSKKIEGKVDNFELNGSYGKLNILNKDSISTVELKIGGIIFDTTKNIAISPTEIKNGSNLVVYTYSDLKDSKLDIDLAEVVLINPKEEMGYTPILNLNKDNDKIEFKNGGKEYVIKGSIHSALSGKEYDERQLSELEDGDRLIYYGVEKDNKVIIDKAYVYPTFE